MLMYIFVIAYFLPLTQSGCSKGCWADSHNTICLYDTAMQGREGMLISYSLKIPFSRICCEALSCTLNTGRCQFENVGCHDNTTVSIMTTPRPWELPNIPTMMRCTDKLGTGAFYWFTPNVVEIKNPFPK